MKVSLTASWEAWLTKQAIGQAVMNETGQWAKKAGPVLMNPITPLMTKAMKR